MKNHQMWAKKYRFGGFILVCWAKIDEKPPNVGEKV